MHCRLTLPGWHENTNTGSSSIPRVRVSVSPENCIDLRFQRKSLFGFRNSSHFLLDCVPCLIENSAGSRLTHLMALSPSVFVFSKGRICRLRWKVTQRPFEKSQRFDLLPRARGIRFSPRKVRNSR